VPDWTYHPLYRPIVFRLPLEDARRLTMAILAFMGRGRIRRELFRLLSYGLADRPVEVFGLTFACRFGLGPDIDVDARTFAAMQFLGCGFLTAGPVTLGGRPRVRRLDRRRIASDHALTRSAQGYAPAAAAVHGHLARRDLVRVPVGITIEDADPAAVITALGDRADFFSLRGTARVTLASARAATTRPVLLRIPLDGDTGRVMAEAARAKEAGLDGVVVSDGEPYAGVPDGRIDAAASLPRVLAAVTAVSQAFGDGLPVIAAGGAVTPEDALACVEAGASLVEISSGFVYSGPGFVGRTLAARSEAAESERTLSSRPGPLAILVLRMWALLALAGAAALLAVSGGRLAGFAHLAPWVLSPAAAASPLVCAVTFATLAAVAAAGVSLARRGQAWTSWMLGLAAVCVLPVSVVLGAACLLGLVLGDLMSGWLRAGFRPLFAPGPPAWRWSAANLGRRSLQASAVLALVLALTGPDTGAVRLAVAGAMGCALLLAQRGLLPGIRSVWLGLLGCAAGMAALAASFAGGGWRTAVAGLSMAFACAGITWLWRPLVQIDEGLDRFPDI
jgi:dihydroorotate dehydrogenase